jgi:hypothetical protein
MLVSPTHLTLLLPDAPPVMLSERLHDEGCLPGREPIFVDDEDRLALLAQHGEIGHLFLRRLKAVPMNRDADLQEVCRYLELNSVRAGMVDAPRTLDLEVSQYAWH